MIFDLALTLLAMFGLGALMMRLLGALLGLGLTAAEASAAASLAEASARRGDVTTMLERQEASTALRRRRVRSAGWVALWLGLIAFPPMLHAGRIVYAAAALLWLAGGRGGAAMTFRAGVPPGDDPGPR